MTLLPPPLDCHVLAARSVGPFVLGTPLGVVVRTLNQMEAAIPQVECKYDESEPLGNDIVLNLSANGICLRFDPQSQRLKLIELFDFERLTLYYKDVEFNSQKVLPTFDSIYRIFGPIYPGEFDASKKEYTLTYPGIAFVFPIPQQHIPLPNLTDLPLSFPDGTTPVLNRLYVYSGSEFWRDAVAPRPKGYAGPIAIKVIGEGVSFSFNPRSVESHEDTVEITFGAPTQDVLDALGKPQAICARDTDPGALGTAEVTGANDSNNASSHRAMNGGDLEAEDDDGGADDYFWNYFNLGIDILFSGAQHAVKKVVLHANAVGHWDFTQYIKAEFVVEGRGISVDSKWDDIQKAMRPTEEAGPPRPVVHNRGGHQNPFGPTCFYGYPGIIFEVMNKTGCLASVTVFEHEP
ncbi:hypothetical protein HDU87_001516 [Geranomyces variabilis]|uniref:Uncharacterized protein n=1 Tax=Geranomyces variabilis TaxID=109894 RepID=A0AAD5TBD0_9FUNG|nr:hypothetical protein HDU87_001516 [Geranomyces variabilis]